MRMDFSKMAGRVGWLLIAFVLTAWVHRCFGTEFPTNIAIASAEHSLALQNDGRVWGWGNATNLQLGTAASNYSSFPLLISGLTNNIVSSASGAEHSLTFGGDGIARSWG